MDLGAPRSWISGSFCYILFIDDKHSPMLLLIVITCIYGLRIPIGKLGLYTELGVPPSARSKGCRTEDSDSTSGRLRQVRGIRTAPKVEKPKRRPGGCLGECICETQDPRARRRGHKARRLKGRTKEVTELEDQRTRRARSRAMGSGGTAS